MAEIVTDWSKYAPFFSEHEFACSHTRKCEMNEDFMDRLYRLRVAFAKPMHISSGYRDKTHPIEAKKASSGAHASGRAADVAVRGADAFELVKLAMLHGFTGIGVNQKGDARFIHLDDIIGDPAFPRPTIWSYA